MGYYIFCSTHKQLSKTLSFKIVRKVITSGYYQHPHNPGMHGIRLIYEIAIMGVLRRIFDLYWQDNFLNNKIQSDKDNFLDNLIYEIAIIGVLGSIFRQDNFLTIYERFWHLGGHVRMKSLVWNYFKPAVSDFVTFIYIRGRQNWINH